MSRKGAEKEDFSMMMGVAKQLASSSKRQAGTKALEVEESMKERIRPKQIPLALHLCDRCSAGEDRANLFADLFSDIHLSFTKNNLTRALLADIKGAYDNSSLDVLQTEMQ
ncbi:hypothetical protein HHI36_018211, partial [Cryptolaemus montrouzieri]